MSAGKNLSRALRTGRELSSVPALSLPSEVTGEPGSLLRNLCPGWYIPPSFLYLSVSSLHICAYIKIFKAKTQFSFETVSDCSGG